ncbi:hypothetical protein [Desulfovibrio ferrophilus]|uniref:Formate-dependent nitrite reductase cytochrome c552 subunit n=1 Tax=Desulfovibrio ferrophilus TaxID=241368 RepID=A0A2Z6AWM6_9BACT|nr:hypothetical protein [Desulfovibrio ferrophilus]BBD07605.1 formate-dependent nitrite reductase cytochrome c552 subunit [Desulfovibrio ferrophilus]
MAEHDAAMRGWLLALLGAAVLFLAGLVLSYILWNRIESAATVPCAELHPARVESAQENLRHAAALMNSEAPELRVSLSHIFQFPFNHAGFIAPYTDAKGISEQLQTNWNCAQRWADHITNNDSYISLMAVAGADVIPIRLQRTEFDMAEPSSANLSPDTVLILRKRPGSDQILIRIQPTPAP